MKIFQINISPNGSTGNIMQHISKFVIEDNNSCITSSAYKNVDVVTGHYFIGNNFFRRINIIIGKITSKEYLAAPFATLKLIRKIKKFSPDVIHIHNLHSYYVNMKLLFNYISKSGIQVVWTFHDCWPFTGGCAHFVMSKCDKWKTQCENCPQLKQYPYSYFDRTYGKYKEKKAIISRLKKLTIVTPSEWLADLVRQSYLKDYPVKVINNGIDLNIFKPVYGDFKKKNNIEDKYVVLGVAFAWDNRKGLDIFIKLSERLGEEYCVVLVGTDENVDKTLPGNMISIHRTSNKQELAEIYSSAEVFVNPTREETYPTVNMEALACGTPVVTFNTGGSPEIIDETCGCVVDCDDIAGMEREVIRVCSERPYKQAACIKRAQNFDADTKYKEYISLYNDIAKGSERIIVE